jgi:hypothetical protein
MRTKANLLHVVSYHSPQPRCCSLSSACCQQAGNEPHQKPESAPQEQIDVTKVLFLVQAFSLSYRFNTPGKPLGSLIAMTWDGG